MASQNKPSIAISESDLERLGQIAQRASAVNPALADVLLAELDRASIVPDSELPASVVRMGSNLRYRTGNGESRAVQLVFPAEADIDAGRISILTPIGAALIGLAPGQSIDWQTVDGRTQVLTVESVTQD